MAELFSNEFLQGLDYETPFFLFSKDAIRNKYQEFKKHFPNATIYYAMKADSEPELLKTLYEEGSSFEVASAYELKLLQDLEIPPDRISYGTSVKPEAHISSFHDYGVKVFAFDSMQEIEKIARVAPEAKVYVRVSVNDTGSIYRFSEKFGTAHQNVVPLLRRAKELGLKHYGISFHVGSQAGNPDAWAHAIRSMAPVIQHLQEVGLDIEILNLGGGFPIAYPSDETGITLEDISRSVYEEYEKLPYKPRIFIEPGRAMVAESAVLVASVVARVERTEHTWLFLDAGVYNGLFESLAYQGSIAYRATPLRPSYDTGETTFALAGPTGDSWDVITREAHLPPDIDVGDKLVFHKVGAYNLVMVGRFNGFPKPDVYFV